MTNIRLTKAKLNSNRNITSKMSHSIQQITSTMSIKVMTLILLLSKTRKHRN